MKKRLIYSFSFLVANLIFTSVIAQTCNSWFDAIGVWQGNGRIAISSEGNEHVFSAVI